MDGTNAKFKEWSSTHKRLRAELLVVSLVAYLITVYGIDVSHLPLIGTSIKGVDKSHVLFGAYALAIYFSIALYFRTKVENLESSNIIPLMKEEISKLEYIKQSLGFDEFYDQIKKFYETLPQLEKSSEHFQTEFERIRKRLQNVKKSDNAGTGDYFDDLNRIRSQWDDAAGFLVEHANEIRRIPNAIYEKLNTQLSNHERLANEVAKDLNAAVDKAQKQIRNIRSVHGMDRNFLGLWIPLAAAGILLILPIVLKVVSFF